jgi:hypothetical protein
MVVSSDQVAGLPMLTAVFSGEDSAEAKSACLARLVTKRLVRRWQGGTLTEAEMGSMIADVMANCYESVNIDAGNLAIEYIGGERRSPGSQP